MAANATTSLKLDSGIKERVQKLATTKRRTAHWIMREAIEQFVEREEKREQFWQETLSSSEHFHTTGLHLTDEEVDHWITKLEAGEDAELPECHV